MTDIGLVNSNTQLDNDKVTYIHFDYTLFSFEYNINSISHVKLNSDLKGETSMQTFYYLLKITVLFNCIIPINTMNKNPNAAHCMYYGSSIQLQQFILCY